MIVRTCNKNREARPATGFEQENDWKIMHTQTPNYIDPDSKAKSEVNENLKLGQSLYTRKRNAKKFATKSLNINASRAIFLL